MPVGCSKHDEGGPCVLTFFCVFLECVATKAVVERATYGEIMSLASEAKRKKSCSYLSCLSFDHVIIQYVVCAVTLLYYE